MFDPQEPFKQLKEMSQKSGYNIPEELTGDPKAMVMHLIQTGQVPNPILQKIMPMIRQLTGN